ncbi:sigma-70 family RNA polymerase sigma factor [Microbacterium rhizophilus]|uniref:sigma-70 family RNA polymerase sigma factor n=1 Tax=Microbacterium rhizophilus TaxID=3138934 RepID=UPI0031EE985A
MTVHQFPDAPEAAPDADLVLRSRSGDTGAFGELWRRHYRSGVVVARAVSSTIDPDDLVQEAYVRIFQAIRRGGGPSGSFRAYLFTAIRNTAAAWGRASRDTAIDELDTLADPETTDEAADSAVDRDLTHTAFRSLPTRWQEVLWYTEIEQRGPAQIAPLLGMTPVAVAQLSSRAREGLREAWIQAHLNASVEGSECRWAIEHLGAHTRGNLGARNQSRLDAHLADCTRCTTVAGEAQEVGSRLALVLLPVTIGVAATASYLAALQRDDVAAVALAAMPSSVVEGAVVAAGGATAGAAGGNGGGSTSPWTVGGLIAAGVAALTVAGIVVAASLGLFPGGGSPLTAPTADDAAPPSTEVEASPELIDGTPAPDGTPTPEPTEDPASPESTPLPRPSTPAPPAPETSAPAPPPTTPPAPETTPLALTSGARSESGDVVLGVTGSPDREVQAFAVSDAASGDGGFSVGVPLAVAVASQEALAHTTLDADGAGTLVFALTRDQALADVTIEVSYVDDSEGIATRRLSELWDLRALLLAEPTPTPTVTPTASPTPTPTPTPTVSPTPPATEPPAPGCDGGWWPWAQSDSCLVVSVEDVEKDSLILVATKVQPYRLEDDGTAVFAIDLTWTDPTDRVSVTAPDGTVRDLGTVGELANAR